MAVDWLGGDWSGGLKIRKFYTWLGILLFTI